MFSQQCLNSWYFMENTAMVKLGASWHSSLYPGFQFLQYRVSGAGITPINRSSKYLLEAWL